MWSRRQLLLSSVRESNFVAPKNCVTFLQRTSLNQQRHLFPLGRSQCSLSNTSSLNYLPSSGALAVSRNREGGRFCNVKGIQQLHSVRTGSEQLKVFMRERACYCHDCLAEHYDRCENTELVDDWKEVKLAREPSGSTTRATEDVTTTECNSQFNLLI